MIKPNARIKYYFKGVVIVNLPETFINKYQKLLGDEFDEFLASFNNPVNHGFRVNPLKNQLPTDLDLTHPTPFSKWGYYGNVKGKSLNHQSGAVYSQEPSAMMVGEVAAPKPGQTVLDLCAAPGGKTTHLASFMQQEGLLVTNEIMGKRAKVLVENVERFGIKNALILNETPESIATSFPNFFDVVLVDAPCSGEGMFRKDPDAISYWSEEYPIKCADRQRTILKEAVKAIKPGGNLVYSTCTFAPEEDEQMIAWLLETYPQFEVVSIDKPAGVEDGRPEWANGNEELKKTARLFPHKVAGEGHFIAKLHLTEAIFPNKEVKKQRDSLTKEQRGYLNDFISEYLPGCPQSDFITFGDQVYVLNSETPDLNHLKVKRPGLQFGVFKKNRFEPSYALALTLNKESFSHCIEIDKEQWAKIVHGDTIKVENAEKYKGWVLLVCENQSVSFGKLVGETVKNYFPKGLRFAI